MKPTIIGLLCAAALAAGYASADDSTPSSSMTPQQAMKDCMEQQKTASVSMSKAQMKRLCKDKIKQQKATGDMPEQPPTDAPHN